MQITPIEGKGFGASVTDVSLENLTDAEFPVIKSAFHQYGFLVFPGQFLSQEGNTAFAQRFGKLHYGAHPMANKERREDGSYGETVPYESQRMRGVFGNQNWHTDSSYIPISAKCGILSAVTVPDQGGETEFADMRAGYAALDQETKERIANLSAYHSTKQSAARDLGDLPPEGEGSIFHAEAYLRPIVKVHPETGVKNLFIGRHAFGVQGLSRQESIDLLTGLRDFVVSEPSRVYSHRWQPGDTVIWDNRCLLHRARPYEYSQLREFIAVRVAGDPETEFAYLPSDPEAQAGRSALRAEMVFLREEAKEKRYKGTAAPEARPTA